MTLSFHSNFSVYIEGMIAQKHALGSPYRWDSQILLQFDRFCIERFPKETNLTDEIGLSWATIRPEESQKSFYYRLAPIRELARYMNRSGIPAYVIPTDICKDGPRYIPHIFTDQELKAFFNAADRIPFSKQNPIRHIIIPVIFRVIYCCGLRPAEARKLMVKDVNLETGALNIQESKCHKDRIVMLSPDVLDLCREYRRKILTFSFENPYFFPNSHNSLYSCSWLDSMFWKCWEYSSINGFQGNRPRVYDFRHTFATKRLYLWLKEGKDLSSLLPYLSAYLGHARFAHTAYYIHLVPEFYPQMAKMDFGRYASLLPEVTL